MDAGVFGREDELSVIRSFLTHGEAFPAALVLEGEAGIGKTAIWRAGLVLARESSARVLASSPAESEAKLSFAALGDLLDGVLDEALPRLAGPQRRALEVALLLEDFDGVRPERRALAVAVLNVLRALARNGPVLVAIDDVQWLDAPSVNVIAFAVRRLREEPVGMLLTRRLATTPGAAGPLEVVLGSERLVQVRVGPLSLGGLHRMLHERLGMAFPRPTLLRIHELSAGNPFFALEIAGALQRGELPHAPGEPLPVPGNLRALIGARLAALAPGVRDTLLVAAALPDSNVALVEAATRRGALRRLGKAAEAGVVDIDGGSIRFAHPLFASILYGDAPPERRRDVHRRLAEVVQSAEEVARHLALAAEGPDTGVAAALDEAARAALGRGAPEAAAELSERARALTPEKQAEEIRRRGIEAAQYHLHAGDTGRAHDLLEELLPSTPPGKLRAAALHALAAARTREDGYAASVGPLEEAAGEPADAELRAQIEVDLTICLLQCGDIRRAAPHARAAAEGLAGLGDAVIAAEALACLAMVEFLLGEGLRRDLVERALALCDAAEQSAASLSPRHYPAEAGIGALLKWSDDFDGARTVLGRLRERAVEQHEEGWLPAVLFQLAELECWSANWAEAARWAQEASETAARTASPTFGTLHLYVQALIDAQLGREEDARSAALEGVAAAERSTNHRQLIRCLCVLGFLELSLGDAAAAHRNLGRANELAAAAGYGDPGVLRFLPDEAEALIELGAFEQAEALLNGLEEQARRLDRAYALAAAGRCRGLLHSARGEHERALACMERALAEHARVPMPLERARTVLTLGRAQRRAKRRRAARETLERALALFEELGAALWVDRTRAELARVGGRARAAGQLTPTERRLAELVAEGRSNKEVAAALFVTPKTVETQLSRIYRKLEVRSRTELANRLARGSEPGKT